MDWYVVSDDLLIPVFWILVRLSAFVFVLEFAFEKFTVKTDLCLVVFTVIVSLM